MFPANPLPVRQIRENRPQKYSNRVEGLIPACTSSKTVTGVCGTPSLDGCYFIMQYKESKFRFEAIHS